jgi:hypothetical protein
MFSEYGIVVVTNTKDFPCTIFYRHKKECCNLFKTCNVAGVLRFMRLQYAEQIYMMEKKGTSLNVAIWNTDGEMG